MMNPDACPRSSICISMNAEVACFRRAEFDDDFVSYDVIPPLHAWRISAAVLGMKTPRWVTQIAVAAPITFEWRNIVTASGCRRALTLKKPHYLVSFLYDPRSVEHVPAQVDEVNAHLGLPDYPATISVLSEDCRGDVPPIDDTRDLGWLPMAVSPGPRKRTIFQRLHLVGGLLDLRHLDDRDAAS